MQDAIVQRIRTFITLNRWSVNSLSKAINVPQMTLNRQLSGVSSLSVETIAAILTTFPLLSAEWLLRGDGPMEISGTAADAELQEVCIDLTKENYKLRKRLAELEMQHRND